MKMHQNGTWFVADNQILNRYNNLIALTNTVGLVIDAGTGTVLRTASKDAAEAYFATMIHALNDTANKGVSAAKHMADNIQLVTFNLKDGPLDIEQICTLINYMNNTIGSDNMKALLALDQEQLIAKAEELARKYDM